MIRVAAKRVYRAANEGKGPGAVLAFLFLAVWILGLWVVCVLIGNAAVVLVGRWTLELVGMW